ncbi:hypothetical protein [Andreprevotia lacus]|jgi:hypothetical protein|uniref:hypothetical protein n=1 Tax=Andreprevotia lacus TaxID=1121000 RepID=UPI00111BDDE7|nr:hypothetical protein [Andreprevotia lacus]
MIYTRWMVLLIFLTGCSSQQSLRRDVLLATPIGTKLVDVLNFCKNAKIDCRPNYQAGYLNQDAGSVVGVKSVYGILKRQDLYLVHLSSEVNWGFDKDGKLIDVWVWNTADSL